MIPTASRPAPESSPAPANNGTQPGGSGGPVRSVGGGNGTNTTNGTNGGGTTRASAGGVAPQLLFTLAALVVALALMA